MPKKKKNKYEGVEIRGRRICTHCGGKGVETEDCGHDYCPGKHSCPHCKHIPGKTPTYESVWIPIAEFSLKAKKSNAKAK